MVTLEFIVGFAPSVHADLEVVNEFFGVLAPIVAPIATLEKLLGMLLVGKALPSVICRTLSSIGLIVPQKDDMRKVSLGSIADNSN